MKKKHIYLLVPLCGLILFSVFYIPFARSYDANQEAKRKQEQQAKQDKLIAEQEARRQALVKANEDADRRKKEREAKAAREQADKDARELALAQRDKAFNDQTKYKDEAASLQKDINAEQKAIAAIQREKEQAVKEQEFLKAYVEQAEANARNILGLLDKMTDAEKKAHEAAEAAKKANNS